MNNDFIEVAQIGKTVGLNGGLRLHNRSDFVEQFKKGAIFYLENGNKLEIKSYKQENCVVVFNGFESIDLAKKLINKILYSTKEQSRKICKLNKDEFFWFDIIDCKIIEEGIILGIIKGIEPVGTTDLLYVKTDEKVKDHGLASFFYIPYNDYFIKTTNIQDKEITVLHALSILENS